MHQKNSTKTMFRKFNFWSHFLLLPIFLSLFQLEEAIAVKFPDGTTAFEGAVLLRDSHTTFSNVRVKQAIYYFDLELPKDAGEPLQKITIKQRTGGDEIKFRPERTKVYLGDHNHKQEQLEAITLYDQDSKTVEVKLNKPLLPGNKLTLGLKPKSNPDYAGVYLFGVTAFPFGKKTRGLYLGAGRLHFYRQNNFDF